MKALVFILTLATVGCLPSANQRLFDEVAAECSRSCAYRVWDGTVRVQPDFVNCICGGPK